MKSKVIELLQNEVNLSRIPGAVLRVSYKGNVILRETIGNRTVYPKKEPMNLDTIFDIASLTKVVATLPAILKLIDLREIHLYDKVSKFIPEFANNKKEGITIFHLLTHTSGLSAERKFYKENIQSEEVFNEIYKEKLTYQTGQKVVYSDLGFMLLSNIVEIVTAQLFSDYLRSELFIPLNMFDTGFNPIQPSKRFSTTEYSDRLKEYKHGLVHDSNAEFMGGVSGHAGLFSTVDDLGNYTSMIENLGYFNGKRILDEATILLARNRNSSFDREYRGLGWVINSLKSPKSCGELFSSKSYGHTGFTGTSMWFDPTIQLNIIFLTNRVHFGRNDYINNIRLRLHTLLRSYF